MARKIIGSERLSALGTEFLRCLVVAGALVAVLAMGALLLLHAFFVLGQYTLGFGLNPRTIHETETNKFFASGVPVATLHGTIAAYAEPQDRVLAFRVAEAAFYGKRPFVSYLDPRLMPVYQSKDASTARDILSGMNIRFVVVPQYALAEIYGTVLGTMLGTPEFARLLADIDSWRLFELGSFNVGGPRPPVWEVDFKKSPRDMRNWHVFDGKYSNWRGARQFDEDGGWLTVGPSRRWFGLRDPRVRLFQDQVLYQESMSLVRDGLRLDPGAVYQVTMHLRGKGLIRAVLEYSGPRGPTTDYVGRRVIWEGVLPDSEKQASAQFTAPLEIIGPSNNEMEPSHSRIVFELVGDATLALGGIKITRVANRPELLQPDLSLDAVWAIERPKVRMIGEPPLLSRGGSSRALAHVGNFGLYPTALRGPLLQPRPSGQLTGRMRLDLLMKGSGTAHARIEVRCVGNTSPTIIPVARVRLDEEVRQRRFTFAAPCAYSGVRALIQLDAQTSSFAGMGLATSIELLSADIAVEVPDASGTRTWQILEIAKAQLSHN